jgi:prepilin-type N-terminal cleavage/methylation domain-containing protein
MKNKKAFTMLELIIAMTLTSVLIVLSLNVLAIFRKAAGQGATLYTAQTDIRRSVTSISDRLRNAAQVYVLPEKFFNANRTLPTDFSFIGVEIVNGKKFLVNYVLKEDGSGHDRRVIAEANDDATFRLELEKNGEDLVGIKIIIDSASGGTQEVTTSVKSLNASQITDWSGGDEGVCIAYSPDPEAGVKIKENPSSNGGAVVEFVLDCSGSMLTQMKITPSNMYDAKRDGSRAYYLRVAGKKFVDKVSEYQGVHLGVQGFGEEASTQYHKALMDLSTSDAQTFYSDLFDAQAYLQHAEKYPNLLPANSGTNIGDGLRMGYYVMMQEAASNGVESLNKYICLITDGEPNFSVVQGGVPYYGDQRIGQSGVTSDYDYFDPVVYMIEVAKFIKNTGNVADYFIITLGDVSLANFYKIADGFGIPQSEYNTHVFSADNDIDFMLAIEQIAGKISVEVERSIGNSLLEGVED